MQHVTDFQLHCNCITDKILTEKCLQIQNNFSPQQEFVEWQKLRTAWAYANGSDACS